MNLDDDRRMLRLHPGLRRASAIAHALTCLPSANGTEGRWRRGELNSRAVLKRRKLLKIGNAKNAKIGQNAELGYAAVTQ